MSQRERRESDRRNLVLEATAWLNGTDRVTGRTVDIGQGGLRLRLNRPPPLARDDQLKVDLYLDRLGERVNLTGRVRWSRRPAEGRGREIGLHLSGPDLARWVLFLDRLERRGSPDQGAEPTGG